MVFAKFLIKCVQISNILGPSFLLWPITWGMFPMLSTRWGVRKNEGRRRKWGAGSRRPVDVCPIDKYYVFADWVCTIATTKENSTALEILIREHWLVIGPFLIYWVTQGAYSLQLVWIAFDVNYQAGLFCVLRSLSLDGLAFYNNIGISCDHPFFIILRAKKYSHPRKKYIARTERV